MFRHHRGSLGAGTDLTEADGLALLGMKGRGMKYGLLEGQMLQAGGSNLKRDARFIIEIIVSL